MDSSKYTYSKSYAFTWVSVWLFLLILFSLRVILNFQRTDWWIFLSTMVMAINLTVCIRRYLLPALTVKVAIEINDKFIINHGEKVEFTSIDHFVLYDSGVIAVILNEKCKRPKNALKWVDYWLTTLIYRSNVTIDTRDVNVKGAALFNNLVNRLDNPELNAAL